MKMIRRAGLVDRRFELKGSGKEENDHPDARDDDHRPKHLRG